MNRRDFLKKAAVVPAVVAVPALAKVPDRMPVPAAPEVVDAAWDELMNPTATEVMAMEREAFRELQERLVDTVVNPPLFVSHKDAVMVYLK